MADHTEDLFDGLDGPRPLPPALRDRLEEQLLRAAGTGDAVPLGAELDERLRTTLTDPVAGALTGIDGPRALSPELRARLHLQLTGRRRRAQRFIGAAAAVVLVAAVALVLSQSGPAHRRAPSLPAAAPAPSTSVGEVAPGAAGVGTGGAATSGGTGTSAGAALDAKGPGAPRPSPATVDRAAAANSGGVVVSSATPDAGPLRGGTTITLQGRGFTTVTQVQFGTRAASYDVLSDTQIRAVTPTAAAAGRVDVVVRVRSGATSRLSGGFAYLPRPVVESVSPGTGASSGGTWVDVKGSALSRATTVDFGAAAATRIEIVSDSELRALSPSHSPGVVDITVTTPGGTSATSTGDRYTYLP